MNVSSLAWRPAATGIGRHAALIALASLAVAASAQLELPIRPVPMTMQSLVVLLIGAVGGWRFGALAMLAYLGEGLVGLPVFAGFHAGLPALLGPTGGYLVGFVPAAALAGWLRAHGWARGPGRAATLLALGHIVIFACGVPVLASIVGWDAAVAFGLTPFLLGTVLKVALGTALMAATASLRRRH